MVALPDAGPIYQATRYGLKLHGVPCETCGHGCNVGLDYWEISRDGKVLRNSDGTPCAALICYMCAARAIEGIIQAGVNLTVVEAPL